MGKEQWLSSEWHSGEIQEYKPHTDWGVVLAVWVVHFIEAIVVCFVLWLVVVLAI